MNLKPTVTLTQEQVEMVERSKIPEEWHPVMLELAAMHQRCDRHLSNAGELRAQLGDLSAQAGEAIDECRALRLKLDPPSGKHLD